MWEMDRETQREREREREREAEIGLGAGGCRQWGAVAGRLWRAGACLAVRSSARHKTK